MKSKERVLAVLEGSKPDRFPMWFGGDPKTLANIQKVLGTKDEEETLDMLGIDFRTIRPKYDGPELNSYEDGSWETFWGIKRSGGYYGQAVNHPLGEAECLDEIYEYDWPNVENWSFAHVKPELEKYKDYAIIGGSWSPFFHDAAELMGLENMLIKMIEKPDLVDAVIKNCFNLYFKLSKKMFEMAGSKIDIFFIGNDFGAEKNMIFSPDLWRKFFKDRIHKMVKLADEFDISFALHSCGDIYSIIPDLIEIGVDILNPIQISTKGMEPKKLMKEFGNKLVFFGGIDVREVLEKGTEEEVRKETRRIIDILSFHNKYITAPSHDYLLPSIPPENIIAMYEESIGYSRNLLK